MQLGESSALAKLMWKGRYEAFANRYGVHEAEAWARDARVPVSITRAAVGGVGTGDINLGPENEAAIGPWTNSARTLSVFYRILDDGAFVSPQLNTRAALMTTSPSAAAAAEGRATALSRFVLNNAVLQPQKVTSLVAANDAVMFRLGAQGQVMLNNELLRVVSSGVDAAFIAKISQGITPATSSNPMSDIRTAMLAVTGSIDPKYYWLASQDTAKFAASLTAAKGGSAFATVNASGSSELAGIPFLISSAIASGTLILIDASQICANALMPTIGSSSEADLEFSNTPTSGTDTPVTTSLVSLFQTDNLALICVAVFGAAVLHSSGVAILGSISSTTWAP